MGKCDWELIPRDERARLLDSKKYFDYTKFEDYIDHFTVDEYGYSWVFKFPNGWGARITKRCSEDNTNDAYYLNYLQNVMDKPPLYSGIPMRRCSNTLGGNEI